MADDPAKTGQPDDQRINVNQQHEVNYWSRKLGVTPGELRKAVETAGPMVADVARQLNAPNRSSN
jgi:hypothetical protein